MQPPLQDYLRPSTSGLPMQPAIVKLLEMGPFPVGDINTEPELTDAYQWLIESIQRPVTDDEARALITLFGPDDFFTLAWSLIHLIETAPGWPLRDCLEDTSNEWVQYLKRYAENAGLL